MESLSREMEKGVEEGVFPGGVLLVSVDCRIEFFEAFGVSDIYSGKRVEKRSVFDLASLTKSLATTLAVSGLISRGAIRLDQRVSSVISAFKDTDKDSLTVEQLLRHTSGLPAHRPYYETLVLHENESREGVLHGLLAGEPLLRSPGRDCLYSDIGFMILEWLVKEASGERLDRFLDKEIYTPLQIGDLFFIDLFSENLAADHENRENRIVATEKCAWRRKMLCGEVHDDNAWAAGGIGGHAGLFGDAGSVLKLAREVLKALQGRETHVLSTMVIRELVKKKGPFSHVAGFDTPSGQNPSAGRYFSSSSIGHLGFTGTSFWIDPESSVIVILLTNRVHPSRENNGIRLFRPKLHDLVMERLLKK